MAETARAESEEQEYFDDEKEFDKKVTKLAELISKSKHCVVFTGAGISTSCGIKDFRSGINTKLETGAGIWALDAAQIKGIDVKDKEKNIKTTSMMNAIPSISHMVIFKLMEEFVIKFVISQNVDGIHIRSGVPRNKIAELHGNTTVEICAKCNTVYNRDFDVIRPKTHKTDRICSIKTCKGDLYDTIVNFGENLPISDLNAARDNTQKGDLCIALGSSLTVRPAMDLAAIFGQNAAKDLVIVNLQKTPLDDISSVRIFGKIDDTMELLMKKLELKIPRWRLKRYIMLKIDDANNRLYVDGMDENYKIPSSIFKSVILKIGDMIQFKGDSKWIQGVKNEYNKNKYDVMDEDAKENELLVLKKALKKCDKSLARYTKMIYDAGYHNVDSLGEFRMEKAVEVMDGSNNYERRKIVDTFSKPKIKDLDELLDGIEFEFNINQLNDNDDDDEKQDTMKNYIEFEFAKHYNEPNLLLDLNKYIQSNQNEYKLKMTYDIDTNKWCVFVL